MGWVLCQQRGHGIYFWLGFSSSPLDCKNRIVRDPWPTGSMVWPAIRPDGDSEWQAIRSEIQRPGMTGSLLTADGRGSGTHAAWGTHP